MYQEIDNKVYEIIDIFKNNNDINKLIALKKEIYKDKVLTDKINRLHFLNSNPYTSEYLKLKKEILNDSKMKEYKKLENALYLIIMNINGKLKDFKRGINNANN